MRQFRWHLLVIQIACFAAFCALWEVIGHSWSKAAFLISRPSDVGAELWSMVRSGEFFIDAGITGSEAVCGLAIGTSMGAVGGLLLWFSDSTARIARPFVLAIGTVPIFAFAPLMIVWFGIGFKMKVALATFATIFVAFSQSYRGATKVSRELLETFQGMGANRREVFWKAVVPSAFDWVLNSMRLNVGLALLGAFIGEFIAAERGLGYVVLRAAGLYDVPRAIAAAIGIVLLGILLDCLASVFERQRHRIVQALSVPPLLWRWKR